MEAQPIPMQPMIEPWQQMANACVSQLKNSSDLFKLVIASDSMVAVDQKQERADNADLLQSTGAFFSQMKDMIDQYPPMAKFAIQFLERVARNYKGGKEVEAMYSDMLNQVAQLAQQKMDAAAQAPPDPAMVKAQTDMQIAQMTMQGKQAEMQASMQNSQVELQIKQVQAQMEDMDRQAKAQVEQSKQALEMWKAQQDVLIENKKIEVEVLKIQAETETQKANQQIAVMQTNIAATIDALRLQMDRKDNEFQKLAQTVDAHQRNREHMDNHLADLANIVQSDAPDKKEKVKSSIRRYKFLKDANGEISGAEVHDASEKPKTPGSLKG
jgi:myosin heavy subunit